MRSVLLALAALTAAVAAPVAGASTIIDRSATNWTPAAVKLQVNAKGEALVTYREAGKTKNVLAWGAVNAAQPKLGANQVNFKLDYSGGYGKYHIGNYTAKFGGSCAAYNGPALAWFVEACKAPDGSYWALQSWQRQLPNYGVKPTAKQAVWELHLSHWAGPLPVLTITTDWAWRQWNHLFGTFTYNGTGVFGYKATVAGVPLDTFGRNVYVDTFDSAYGSGWHRENSFLTHTGTGAFCYSINPHKPHPAGTGKMYRATIQGPGVMPDIMWQGKAPAPYDKAAQALLDEQIVALHDPQCKTTD